jgi:hypothetical protein
MNAQVLAIGPWSVCLYQNCPKTRSGSRGLQASLTAGMGATVRHR